MRAKESVVLFFLSIQSGDWDHHGTFSWLQQLRWKCFPGQTMTYGRKSWDSLHSDSNSIGRWTIHWIITGEWKGLRRSFLVIWVFSLFSHIDNCHHLFSAAIGFASQMSHLSFCLVSPSITSVFFFFKKILCVRMRGPRIITVPLYTTWYSIIFLRVVKLQVSEDAVIAWNWWQEEKSRRYYKCSMGQVKAHSNWALQKNQWIMK